MQQKSPVPLGEIPIGKQRKFCIIIGESRGSEPLFFNFSLQGEKRGKF
jgi:hypothetical protein